MKVLITYINENGQLAGFLIYNAESIEDAVARFNRANPFTAVSATVLAGEL